MEFKIALICMQRSLLSAVLMFILSYFSCGGQDTESKNVRVLTDKTEYLQSEPIIIALENCLVDSIYSHIGSLTPVFAIQFIEIKADEDNWLKLYAQCQYPDCIYDIDSPTALPPGETDSFKWDPLIYVDGGPFPSQPGSGLYRISVLYLDKTDNDWKSAFSNTFLIN